MGAKMKTLIGAATLGLATSGIPALAQTVANDTTVDTMTPVSDEDGDEGKWGLLGLLGLAGLLGLKRKDRGHTVHTNTSDRR